MGPKACGSYHKQQYYRQPLLQADHGFLIDKDTRQDIRVLSCIGDYPLAELRRFLLERGQEASIRGLAHGLASYTGTSVRQAPAYSHKPQGSIERHHSTLWQQVRTLRVAVKENYDGYDIKA